LESKFAVGSEKRGIPNGCGESTKVRVRKSDHKWGPLLT